MIKMRIEMNKDLRNLLLDMIQAHEITNQELQDLILKDPEKYTEFLKYVGTIPEPK
jgi:hypothetical protein